MSGITTNAYATFNTVQYASELKPCQLPRVVADGKFHTRRNVIPLWSRAFNRGKDLADDLPDRARSIRPFVEGRQERHIVRHDRQRCRRIGKAQRAAAFFRSLA